jgi:adenosylcobinamide kinase / adenosylcobinamide-phosphate guanylyltransferase
VIARLILVGGGARSGKSHFALGYARQLAAAGPLPALFVATGQAFDDEMRSRIDRHRSERGPELETMEEPLRLASALAAADPGRVVLVDCLTLWLSNLLLADTTEAEILRQVEAVAATSAERAGPTLLVTNEVGLGLVPETPLGRRFRDLAGATHQRLAAAADEVYAAIMGMVLRIHPIPVVSFRRGELP